MDHPSSRLWLTSPDGQSWLEQAAQAEPAGRLDPLRAIERLRRDGCPQPGWIVEQWQLRHRARAKFAHPERMLFTPERLEQSTDEGVAHYKAQRVPPDCRRLADLCCGLGGDAMALATRSQATLLVDLDPVAVGMAEFNVRQQPHVVGRVEGRCQNVGAFADAVDVWHIDPDRRPGGARTTQLEHCLPGQAILEALVAAQPNGIVKLAPATQVPEDWQATCEREWIAHRGECRQQVLWWGDLATTPGQHRATSLDVTRGAVASFVAQPTDTWPLAQQLGRYLGEPSPAVLAAQLAGSLAEQAGLRALAPRVPYFTGDQPPAGGLWQSFEVVEVLGFHRKRIATWLQTHDIGKVEVKRRGLPLDPLALQRQWQSKRPGHCVLILTPWQGQAACLVAKRVNAAE